jgi:hypothetical protein
MSRSRKDDDQERPARLLLLGKGAVPAQRLARPLAAQMDEEQEHTVGLLLLGKGPVLPHEFERPLAVEMDEYEQPVR